MGLSGFYIAAAAGFRSGVAWLRSVIFIWSRYHFTVIGTPTS